MDTKKTVTFGDLLSNLEEPSKKEVDALIKQNDVPVEISSNGVNKDDKEKSEEQQKLQISWEMDRGLLQWMRTTRVSFLITSYKTGKVYSLGTEIHPQEGLVTAMYMTTFNQPMGIYVDKKFTWLSTRGNFWQLNNEGESADYETKIGKYDATFVPRLIYTIGDIDPHDVTVDAKGQPYFCSAKYNCVCMPSTQGNSFEVYWMPPWIDKLSQEDRCHLNGLCCRDGEPRYISACGKTNSFDSWHENRIGKGVVHDIKKEVTLCDNLTMPHSPRWFNGKVWLLNSGNGEFGYIDCNYEEIETTGKLTTMGKFVAVKFLPGFLRGLTFVNEHAVIGSSDDRKEKRFQGMPLGERLAKDNVTAKCGIFVVELKTFDIVHNMKFDGVTEIYDVGVLNDVTRPCVLDINSDTTMNKHNTPVWSRTAK